MLPLASASLLLHPSWRDRAIQGGLALSDAASRAFTVGALAPVYPDRDVTPFDRYPLNSYLVHDPEVDLDEWRLSVAGLVQRRL